MKKLWFIVALLLLLVACQSTQEVEPTVEYSQKLSEVASTLGVTLDENTATVLRAIIYLEEDFNWWAEQNGYVPLTDYDDELLFELFLTWSGLPEDQKRPNVEEPPVVTNPFYWENPPAVNYKEGYWTAWNLNYDYFIHYSNYAYIFIQPDGTNRYIGSHPNQADWEDYGIPIPIDKGAFNSWLIEAPAWAIQYYLDHFTGDNADYQLPPIPTT